MRRRIFIAINLPENIKNKLADYRSKWLELPCRWTKKDNLHITLVFLGYISDEELLEICKITKETALKHEPFFINLKKIVYGPPKKQPPRMVWIEGEKSEELGRFQRDLENSLSGLSSESEGKKEKGYAPHITLGRLKQWEFQKIELEERPEINEDIDFSFEVTSVEVMESELKKMGPEYFVLESIPLKQ